jgi:hypothetical protein
MQNTKYLEILEKKIFFEIFTLFEDHLRIIPVKIGQNPSCGL